MYNFKKQIERMKKQLLSLGISLFISASVYGQVGVNTPSPNATFDITAKNSTGTSTNKDGLLIPRIDRQRAQSMTNVETSTMIYVNDISTGTQAGSAVNIDASGYYYYDGSAWVKFSSGNSGVDKTLYNTDGTLAGNRTVTQNANWLTFTGTAVNAFSVDGNTFSVDASNNRVGIGTTNPYSLLDLGTAVGQTTGDKAGKKLSVWSNANEFYGLGVSPGILQFHAASASDGEPDMVLTSTGNFGIGTSAPDTKAILDLSSTEKGFLPPRLTTVQRDAITSPPAGLMIYNTTLKCMQYWNDAIWMGNCSTGTGTITTLDCAGAAHNGTLTAGTAAATGVTSVISYTGGNGGAHAGQVVTSTGVTGLTATLSAGDFANGNGTLTYTITGTPSGAGTASFAINIGGQSCTLTRTVVGGVPPPNMENGCQGIDLPHKTNGSVVNGTVDGQNLSVNYTTVTTQTVPGSIQTLCNVTSRNGAVWAFTATGQKSILKFNREVTNFKIEVMGMWAGSNFEVILKKNGVAVSSPTVTKIGCSFMTTSVEQNKVTMSTSTTSNAQMALVNIGGVWFDEIEIVAINQAAGGYQPFQYCIGNTK